MAFFSSLTSHRDQHSWALSPFRLFPWKSFQTFHPPHPLHPVGLVQPLVLLFQESDLGSPCPFSPAGIFPSPFLQKGSSICLRLLVLPLGPEEPQPLQSCSCGFLLQLLFPPILQIPSFLYKLLLQLLHPFPSLAALCHGLWPWFRPLAALLIFLLFLLHFRIVFPPLCSPMPVPSASGFLQGRVKALAFLLLL